MYSPSLVAYTLCQQEQSRRCSSLQLLVVFFHCHVVYNNSIILKKIKTVILQLLLQLLLLLLQLLFLLMSLLHTTIIRLQCVEHDLFSVTTLYPNIRNKRWRWCKCYVAWGVATWVQVSHSTRPAQQGTVQKPTCPYNDLSGASVSL